jgi:hypothetical protein
MASTDGPENAPTSTSEERAGNIGCGIALLVAGGIMIAGQLGWIKNADWLFPAILIGWGANYLYKALSRR